MTDDASMAARDQLTKQGAQKYVAALGKPTDHAADASYRRAFDSVTDLKRRFRAGSCVVALSKQNVDPLAKKETPSYKLVGERQTLRAIGIELKSAKKVFSDFTDVQAQRQCRFLFEAMYAALPRELRNIVYGHFIFEDTATFYLSRNGQVKLANGRSPLQHLFDPAFTGQDVHKDMIEELSHRRVTFDFRRSPEIMSRVFSDYESSYGIDLAKVVHIAGLIITSKDVKRREEVRERLGALCKLQRGAYI
jgi:hypothetical protein